MNHLHRSSFERYIKKPQVAQIVEAKVELVISFHPESQCESQGVVNVAQHQALGQQIHLELVQNGADSAAALAKMAGQPDLFDRVKQVASETPIPSFLHSALCAMSLPIRRPTDDQAPIIRQDGNYTLVITPKPVVTSLDGSKRLQSLGVPYGTMPRLILIHIMTEAVRTRSRQIVLGSTFTEWMRRMGFRTFSYGPRGSATILREQLDRLLACEWMIRWDSDNHNGDHEFAIREIKLSDEYVGVDRKNGGFKRELVMTEGFFSHLRDHAVPLNEHAIRQLRESATALDLYTWLAYRLPRINSNRALTINWSQLAVHFGNDQKNIRKFRHTIRDAWERHVSAVYPDAKADFSATVIKLFSSPPPLHQKIYPIQAIETKADAKGSARGGQLDDEAKDQEDSAIGPGGDKTQRFLTSLRLALGPAEARGWLQDVSFEKIDGAWTLITENEFKASWIRSHFDHALRKAAKVAEIEEPVQTNARPAKR